MNSAFHGLTRTLQIRINDLDGGGIVYHARYVSLVDDAMFDYWMEAGWNEQDVFPVVRALNVEYLSPVTSVGPVDVRICIVKRARTSVTYEFDVRRGDTVHAGGTRTNVFVDAHGRAVEVPEHLWAMAEPLLPPAA